METKKRDRMLGAMIVLIGLILLLWVTFTGIGDAWSTLSVISQKQLTQITVKEFLYIAFLLLFIYKLIK